FAFFKSTDTALSVRIRVCGRSRVRQTITLPTLDIGQPSGCPFSYPSASCPFCAGDSSHPAHASLHDVIGNQNRPKPLEPFERLERLVRTFCFRESVYFTPKNRSKPLDRAIYAIFYS